MFATYTVTATFSLPFPPLSNNRKPESLPPLSLSLPNPNNSFASFSFSSLDLSHKTPNPMAFQGSGEAASLSAVGSDSDKVPTVSHQEIIIKNNLGENLVGILHNAGSTNLVILCHGFRSSKESRTLTIVADALTNEGISVFLFDFSGNGESEGLFQYGNYWKEVNDLRAVIQNLTKKNYQVDAIAGHSKGGNVVLLYASMYHDVSTVINISGRFDVKRGIEDRLGKDFMERIRKDGYIDVVDKMGKFMYRVTEDSLEDRLNTDMHAACLSIDKNCRVLTVHGSEDDIVPPEDALEFSKLIINHKLQIIEGADHRYLTQKSQLAKILVDFIGSNEVIDANL